MYSTAIESNAATNDTKWYHTVDILSNGFKNMHVIYEYVMTNTNIDVMFIETCI